MGNIIFFLCYVGFFGDLLMVNFVSGSAVVYRTQTTRNMHNICPPIEIQNGLARRRARGRVAKFFCVRGFLLAGEKLSTCTRGKWDPEIPRCVRPTCKTLSQQNTNGNILIYPTHSGAVQHFFCKAGNYLNGPRDIYCNGSIWSNNVPTCITNNQKPPLSCNFEDLDICGWTHDPNHDFDWKRENYNTPSGSIGTGPSFDHTKGRGQDGYYMYIESSSKSENDSARLISPVYDVRSDDLCFKFYYHMFGATIGTLRVYLKTINESWKLNPESAFFSKSKNQGDKWYRSLTHLGSVTEQFQIIIEGVRGNGYVSDIAIDDVEIIPNCENEEESTTSMYSSTDNEMFPIIDTCEDRCGQKENITELYHLTCDCDDDCFISNRCCPDFYDTCIDTTWDTTPPIDKSETEGSLTTAKEATTANHLTKSVYTTQTRRPVTTVAPRTTTRFMHVIRFNTPPVTPRIFRRTTTTTLVPPLPPSTTRSNRTTVTTPTSSVTEHKDDVLEVPRPTNIDELLYDAISGSKEFWSDEVENAIDAPSTRNFSESNKLFSQVRQAETSSHLVIVSLSVCAAVVLISVVSFVVIRRYIYSRNVLQSSNGESQSDVRYLTNSDVLDLSLANVYDELLN
ncbi:uncharacterized protein LOC114330834 [Diabrotica virgifera virgifera]|uniref:Uncharacterized protein LOC114330834 n=1 Tax=Diabrotica virgifera virgifera TaxID=50390 RepID=A0A6P7FTE3_DIAVI|nr:uncharacterized protein LOC114330834 [Diabrotica virgifera virgifera]